MAYYYDGDGRRVQTVSAGGTTTFVYDAKGELVAEYGSTTTLCQTCYVTVDSLGSARMVTDQNGTVVSRQDYLPFGQDILTSSGNPRYGIQGYASPGAVRQQFTAKERDAESGLDFFEARYYSSAQGRFTSPDPLYLELHRLSDPQQLNLYAYGRNNPLKFTDPLGLDISCGGDRCDDYLAALQKNTSFQIALEKGKIVTVGDIDKKKLSKSDKAFLEAIDDKKHHVTINATSGEVPGSFFGSSDEPHTGTHTIFFGQVALLDSPTNAGGMTSAGLVGHETLEGYYESQGAAMGAGHEYANSLGFGGLDATGRPGSYSTLGGMVVSITGTMQVHGTSTYERITLRLATPVPVADFLKGKGAPYPASPIKVEIDNGRTK